MLAVRRKAPSFAIDLVHLLRDLARAVLDPYRPELHYMRGPGPRWHAKHDAAAAPDAHATPALIRLRTSGR